MADVAESNVESSTVGISSEDLVQIAINFLQNGKTLGELQGLTEEQIETIYSVAYSIYTNGGYEQANQVFEFLCFFDHLEKKHWLGLGACRQMLKQYEKAVEAYSYATLLEFGDPQPPLLAADCHIALGNREQAISGLTAAIEWSGDRPEFQAIRERATALMEFLSAQPAAASETAA